MKKYLSVVLAIILVLTFAGCSDEKKALIGVCQYGEHPSLDNCRLGFIEGLKEAGFSEGTDYTLDYQNGGFDDAVCTQIAQSFAAEGCTLMVGVATNAALACYAASEDNDTPVVFVAVSDPEGSKLTKGNITGTCDKLPVAAQLELIRKLQPDAKTIGIIYTVSETNSVSTIKEYERTASAYGFSIESVGVSAQSEVTLAVDTLINKGVDCFSNLTDNNVVGVLDSILEKTDAASIPVYGSEIEQVKKGCIAGAGIDYYELGKQTGRLAARILNGEKAEDIDFETIENYSVYVNPEKIAALNIDLPDDVAAKAVDVTK
ncbi:MAG: ABC transporter substrate-binding protein [Eubacteriaceae bacterium]|nr:ABC transporter substrate-binding protein [Eubacteriaceae bacterium]